MHDLRGARFAAPGGRGAMTTMTEYRPLLVEKRGMPG